MARKPTSLKSASGGGYSFEDYVAASFALTMLAGETVLSAAFGVVTRLDFYTRESGWLIDDLLVSFSSNRRLALSIKSNQQVTSQKVSPEFTDDAWEQFLKEDTDVFDDRRDYLGLVTTACPPAIRSALDDLTSWSSEQDEGRFLQRLAQLRATSDLKRRLFGSIAKCPACLAAKHGVTARDAVRLLRRLLFLHYDFATEKSNSRVDAIRQAQRTLRQGTPQRAAELWEALVSHVHAHRLEGGYTDLRRIVVELGARFELKSWPQYESDIAAIRTWSSSRADRIPDTIGYTLRISRTRQVDDLQEALDENKLVALVGPSGCGKSVVLKNWFLRLQDTSVPVLWIDGSSIATHGMDGIWRRVSAQHELDEIASYVTSPCAYCVVDGAGIISGEGCRDLAFLVRTLGVLSDQSPWRFVLACQEHEWIYLYDQMNRACGQVLNWLRVNVGALDDPEDLETVWEAFPALRPLSFQRNLRTLLLRPKILDMVACKLTHGSAVDTAPWIGETSVAQWFWQEYVEKRTHPVARSKAALALAERQADAFANSIRTDQAPEAIDDLLAENVVVLQDGEVSFQHDLYGDWARLRILIAHQDDLATFVTPRLVSPFWNRAVRLYSMHLLEGSGGVQRWEAVLATLGSVQSPGNVGQDLVLEAVIFAANPLQLLEMVWIVLSSNGGKWLRRLLDRFLIVATEPDPVMLRLATDAAQQIRYASQDRRPWWPLWLPMLQFLDAHRDEAVDLSGYQVAEVARLWLRNSQPDWPCRGEAARLGMSVAEKAIANEYNYAARNSEFSRRAFRAAVAGILELPEEVGGLIRKCSGRTPRPTTPGSRPYDDEDDPSYARPVQRRRIKNVEPWPDGPVQEPNEAFAEMCVKTDCLFPVIDADPTLASEALLAILIKVPPRYEPTGELIGYLRERDCEIENDHTRRYYPPFWWHYPWLYFLNTQPEHAISTIVRLVDFAAARQCDAVVRRDGHSPSITCTLPGMRRKRTWVGAIDSYMWYTGRSGPHTVSSVLMSLEWWLYQQLDSGVPIERWLQQIEGSATSIPFLGLLACVACKSPGLLRGTLAFLVAIPEVLYMERQRGGGFYDTYSMRLLLGEDSPAAKQWFGMEHRKVGLDEVARRLLITDRGTRSYFARVRKIWAREYERCKRRGWDERATEIERLISAFDPADYTFEYSEEHQATVITHQFPSDLEERVRPAREMAEFRILRTTFPFRCQSILDGEQTLGSDADADAFWDDCQKLLAEGVVFDGNICREDIACGAAAVLTCKCQGWLERYPVRRDWCAQVMKETAIHPPGKGDAFDDDMVLCDTRWRGFCARAIPHLWSEQPGDLELRTCVMLLALDSHYEAVRQFFQTAFALREQLGEQFDKLVALSLYWARERPLLSLREDAAQERILRTSERRSLQEILATNDETVPWLSPEFTEVARAFLSDTLPARAPSILSGPRTEQPGSIRRLGRKNKRRQLTPAVDLLTVKAVYGCLPALAEARDKVERSKWIAMWAELLESLLETLRPTRESDTDNEMDGGPYDVDRWILECIAVLVRQLNPTENPERFWGPILDLGDDAHDWVRVFVDDFLVYGLSQSISATASLWNTMIEYAFKSPAWDLRAQWEWNAIGNWEHLLGMRLFTYVSWPDQYEPALQVVKVQLKRFICTNTLPGSTIGLFLRLMRCPAAKSMQVEALTWVEPILAGCTDERFWDPHDGIQGHLGLLLAEAWHNHKDQIRSSAQSKRVFHSLAKLLVDRQDAIGIELQNRAMAN